MDGTVKCFSGGHAGLATFAILALIVCSLLIIALVIVVLGNVKVCTVITISLCGNYMCEVLLFASLMLQRDFTRKVHAHNNTSVYKIITT